MASRSFTKRDLDRLFRTAVVAAGPRYTRETNVEVPISDAFEALRRAPSYFRRLDELAYQVERSRTDLLGGSEQFHELAEAAPKLRGLALRCARVARAIRAIPRDPVMEMPFGPLGRSARHLEADAEAIAAEFYRLIRGVPTGDAGKKRARLLEGIARGISSVRSSAAEVASFCGGPHARVSNLGALLLVGEAGQGKTHLFCDLVRRALAERQPAVLHR